MNLRSQTLILSAIVLIATSAPALARQETWQLTYWPAPWLTELKATWQVTISDQGQVTATRQVLGGPGSWSATVAVDKD